MNRICFVCIFRQHLEKEALKQKHQDEIEAFRRQLLMPQLNVNTTKFETLQQTSTSSSSSSSTVSTPAVTAVYPVMYQSMAPAYTGNSMLFILLKKCRCTLWLVNTTYNLFWNPVIHYYVDKSPPLIPMRSQMNPIHAHPVSLSPFQYCPLIYA